MKLLKFSLYLLFCILLISAKQVYQCQDSHGNTLYTDNPDSDPNCINAIKKQIKALPSFPSAIKSPKSTTDKKSNSKNFSGSKSEATYKSISIVSPQNNQLINNCGGQLNISTSVLPEIYPDDNVQLYLDGSPFGTPTSSTNFTISSMDRGNHSLAVSIIRNDKEIISSDTINFQFMRNCAKQTEQKN